ncbi:MAG: glycosyltransferase family 39 protein [Alcaligenaceae bacterium]
MSASVFKNLSFVKKIESWLMAIDPNDSRQLARITVAYIVFHACFWALLAIVSYTAPHKDSIEELFWMQSFAWGYPKFGPIGTWWVHAWASVFGRSFWMTYVAGQANVALMLLVVWRISLLCLNPARALMAVVLTSLIVYHNINGLQVSSNLLQLLPTALFVWTLLLAVRQPAWWRWVLVGVTAAVCLLTKYSAGIWFAVMGVWLLQDPRIRNKKTLMGLIVAVLAGGLAMVPHFDWLIRENAPTLQYMQKQVGGEVNHLMRVLSFLASQLGKLSPLLLTLAVLHFGFKQKAEVSTPAVALTQGAEWRFISFAALGPVILTSLLGTVFITLNANWATAFFVMFGVYALRWVPALDSKQTLMRVLTVGFTLNVLMAVGMALYYGVIADVLGKTARANYPAKPLASKLDQIWDEQKLGPLKVVIGETWTAGTVSVVSKYQPLVLPYGLYSQTKAVTPELIKRCGALIVMDLIEMRNRISPDMQSFITRATKQGSFEVYWNRYKKIKPIKIDWAIIEPEQKGGC